MPLPTPTSPVFPLPLSNITIPQTPFTTAALAFLTQHTRPSTVNHCLRSAAFALLLAPRLPQYSTLALDTELLVTAILLHDMGWATTPSLLSGDKGFEVDGAIVARDFVSEHASCQGAEEGKGGWDGHRLQLLWDAIALHTTGGIALWKEGEVGVVHLGILADFLGVYMGGDPALGEPGQLISVDEYREIVTAFPREGFKEDLVHIMCGLCKNKAATTFDTFVGEFGLEFGLDGKGADKEKYREQWDKARQLPAMLGSLDRNAAFEK